MHTPVLLQSVLEAIDIQPGDIFIDATAGEGGHLFSIAAMAAQVLAIDWDANQIGALQTKNTAQNVVFAIGNYADIEAIAKNNGFDQVDGVLFDLGLSMQQLAQSGRGFSFKNEDEPLDMRLNDSIEAKASDYLFEFTENELYDVFAKYAEELKSQEIAQAVVEERRHHRIERVGDLVKLIKKVMKTEPSTKTITRIFQALRIVTNNEFDNIRKGLNGAFQLVKPGGKIAVITFHSLEDRIVKQFMREKGLREHIHEVIPGNRELSFERSAKLRVMIRP